MASKRPRRGAAMPDRLDTLDPRAISTGSTDDAATSATETRRRFLALAADRFTATSAAEHKNRVEALLDDAFRNLEQWDPDLKRLREDPNTPRPCLVIDKLGQPIRQVTNQQKRARPSIKISPKGDGASRETAAILDDLVRQIEYDSDAESAYAWAFEGAATSGWGWWRVITEAAGDDTFDFDLRIKRVLNKYTVYADPSAIEPDASDMRFCFITETLTHEEYRDQYPDSQLASLAEFSSLGDSVPDWITGDAVKVAEYFYVKPKRVTLLQLNDGRQTNVLHTEVVPPTTTEWPGQGQTFPILNRRDVDLRQVYWAKINAIEILDGNEAKTEGRVWDGKYIPMVRVVGEELYANNAHVYRGMIRAARDSQRLYNYEASALAERLATDTKTPWIGYKGQFTSDVFKWQTSNQRNWPFIEVDPVTVDGKPAPLPQRNAFEPPVAAIVTGIQQADNDIKATTGFFDPSLGNFSRERSGKAIERLQAQGELGNSNYEDSLRKALVYTGRILVDLIPKVYNRPGRILSIRGLDDEQSRQVVANAPFQPGADGAPPQPLPPGMPFNPQQHKRYDLTRGQYSVTVSVRRAFNTRREEGAALMGDVMERAPGLIPAIADIWADMLDVPGSDRLAARLRKMLPPNLQEQEGAIEIPPAVQVKIQAYEQQIDLLTQQLNKLVDARDQKAAELASKEKIVYTQEQTKLDIARLDAELEKLKIGIANAHEAAMATAAAQEGRLSRAEDQAHAKEMAALGGQQQADLAAQTHEQTLAQQAAAAAQSAAGPQAGA